MIRQLILKNFKLFKEETVIPLSNINLLTGINGRGKSSVLQSLLLMRQSPEFDRTTNKIILNGEDVKLGTFKDIKNISSTPIDFTFFYETFSIRYRLSENPDDAMVVNIDEIYIEGLGENPFKIRLVKDKNELYKVVNEAEPSTESIFTSLYDLFINESLFVLKKADANCEMVKQNINFSKIHYVSADRVGPKLYYIDKSLKDFHSVGSSGEDTVNVLFHAADEFVGQKFLDNLNHFFHIAAEEVPKTVGLQAQFWLGQLFGGAKYDIKRVDEANLLTFSISPDGSFNYFKPTNVGYGYTYLLPIIVAGLTAKAGDLLIVENPEAHLHPFAQSVIAKFLTLVSMNDVQVIIESHSEHILNGLRIPVYNGIVKNEHLNVLYFDRSVEKYFKPILIDDKGGIADWPPDFFDQATRDLNYLFGI